MYVTWPAEYVVSLMTLGGTVVGALEVSAEEGDEGGDTLYLVSRSVPERMRMRQWASAWSWMRLPLPGDQTRMRRLHFPFPTSTRFRVYTLLGSPRA